MGAWGIKTFENDDASDWIYDLEKTADLSLIESTLRLSRDDYLQSPDACNILAAAEVVLALRGKARPGFPEDAASWVSGNSSLDAAPLNDLAISAVEKVLSEESELNELWQETEDFDDWKNDVLGIKSALQA